MDFNWHSDSGDRINAFLDNLCEKFPKVASCVAERGFDDLGSWYMDDDSFRDAKCGCLIGSTSLCLVASLPDPEMFEEMTTNLYSSEEKDGAIICYLAWKNMIGEDVNFDKDERGQFWFKSRDPLYEMIYEVGIDVTDEAGLGETWHETAEEDVEYEANRMAELKEYMTNRLRSNLKKEV